MNIRIVAFCTVIGLAVGYVQGASPLQWNPVYSVKGVVNIPFAELHAPFYARFDSNNGKSRIDYYAGKIKTIQLAASVHSPFGTSIQIGSESTETVMRKETCVRVNGMSDNIKGIQSVLPDMTDFKYIGTEDMQDSHTSKWQMTQMVGDQIKEYTMWVTYRKSLRGHSAAIPVRYEVKVFNSQLDSHYDHYYLDYSDYNVDEIHPDVFKVSTFQCASFPGLDKVHFGTFNPMKEFVYTTHGDKELTSSTNHLADSDGGSRNIRSTCTVVGTGTCSGTCTVIGSGHCSGSCTVHGSGTCSGSCMVIGSGTCSGSCIVIGSHSCSG